MRRSLPFLAVFFLGGSSLLATSYSDLAWFSISPAISNGPVTVSVHSPNGDGGGRIQGWSLGVCHDPNAARVLSYDSSAELAAIRDGEPPYFYLQDEDTDPSPGAGVIQTVILEDSERNLIPPRAEGFPVLHLEYGIFRETSIRVCGGLQGSGEVVESRLTVNGNTYSPSQPASATLLPAWISLMPAVSDGEVTVSIHTRGAEIRGWALGICHDLEAARIASFSTADELAAVNDGEPPYFYQLEEGSSPEKAGIIQAIILAGYQARILPARPEGFPIIHLRYEVFQESDIGVCDGLQGSGQPVRTALTIQGYSFHPPLPAAATLAQKPYAQKLAYRVEPPESSEVVMVKLYSEEVAVEGWSFALCHTAGAAEVEEVRTAPGLERVNGGEPPEVVLNEVVPADPFVAVKQTVLLGTPSRPLALGPFPDGLAILGIRYRVHVEDHLKFCDTIGSLTFANKVTIEGIGYEPRTRASGRLVTGSLGSHFIRGDADLSGEVDLTDAIAILHWLFLGGDPLPCLNAADANDVGRVDLTDAIYILRYLFLGDPAPLLPFPEAGEDLTPEEGLGCERGM
ncbi:MAG: hypothetical protein HY717_02725 [Planctomycetes bacterium]|nr:hypothetical protein [Planctomycetota bacterium]